MKATIIGIRTLTDIRTRVYTNRTSDTVHNSYDPRVSLVKFTVQVYHIIQTFKGVSHNLVLLLLLYGQIYRFKEGQVYVIHAPTSRVTDAPTRRVTDVRPCVRPYA